MDQLYKLALNLKEDLIDHVNTMTFSRKFNSDSIKYLTYNHLKTDYREETNILNELETYTLSVFRQHYDDNAVFYIHKEFNVLMYGQNLRKLPTRIVYCIFNDTIEIEWHKNDLMHRTNGPSAVVYDIKNKIAINSKWYINGEYINAPIISEWLLNNNLPEDCMQLTEEFETLFQLQFLNYYEV